MPWCSTLKTTIPFGSCPIALLSISNIYVSSTPAIVGKVPYLVALVALLGARDIVVKMALGVLGQIFPRLLSVYMVVSGGIICLPFVIRLFRIGTEFLIHKVVSQLNRLIQRLRLGRLHIPIDVIRKSTDVLVDLLSFTSTKLGT
ncbi:hypothetical protein Tco_0718015 [Tanacetum coccineum]